MNKLDVYASFGPLTRKLLIFWLDRIVRFSDQKTASAVFADINQQLAHSHIILLFDHHYAFDAVPLMLTLARHIGPIFGALVPYAVSVDIGLNREGLPSIKYRIRSQAFLWLIRRVHKANPMIYYMPTVREFERETPRYNAIVERDYPNLNLKFVKKFLTLFTRQQVGSICVLSPMNGLAFPEKPVLHPQVYRTLDVVQRKVGTSLPCYLMGAYPNLKATYHYMAPLLSTHTLVTQESFYIPNEDYECALALVAEHLRQLRQAVGFTPLDYERISRK